MSILCIGKSWSYKALLEASKIETTPRITLMIGNSLRYVSPHLKEELHGCSFKAFA